MEVDLVESHTGSVAIPGPVPRADPVGQIWTEPNSESLASGEKKYQVESVD